MVHSKVATVSPIKTPKETIPLKIKTTPKEGINQIQEENLMARDTINLTTVTHRRDILLETSQITNTDHNNNNRTTTRIIITKMDITVTSKTTLINLNTPKTSSLLVNHKITPTITKGPKDKTKDLHRRTRVYSLHPLRSS